ncbi:MAG TPA: permease prefix domain 1-containing protein [Verrucomicrobiae bacterium]|jgi:hypothetical protein
MNNMDQAIANWRRQMTAAGVSNPQQLDELESHLRQEVSALVSTGMPEAEAVPLALSRLGQPAPLRAEFDKVNGGTCWPVKIGAGLWVVLALAMVAFVAFFKTWELLLSAHVFCVTTGYFAAFASGGFGACYVVCRFFRALPAFRQNSLVSAGVLFAWIAAGLVVAAFALGMIWSHQHLGTYMQGDSREFGALSVILCFLVLAAMRLRVRVSERAAMLWCIGGSALASLAWFGPFLFSIGSQTTHPARIPGYLPAALSIFVGIHLVLLIIGIAPVPPPPSEAQ